LFSFAGSCKLNIALQAERAAKAREKAEWRGGREGENGRQLSSFKGKILSAAVK